MRVLGDVALAATGLALVATVLDSAVRTFVLPRASSTLLTRLVFVTLRRVFDLMAGMTKTYEGRDRVMAFYAPIGLFALVGVWLGLVLGGFTLIYRGLFEGSWRHAFELSGSSIFTLGFVTPPGTLWAYGLAFTEAAVGLGVLALLIAYLPTIYGAFSRREVLVAKLSVRAGTPPSGASLLVRAQRMQRFNLLDDLWLEWQTWFAELEETHTSLAILTFFRSPQPDRSWVTSAGAVLDAASLYNSVVGVPFSPNAGACVRAGFLALQRIAAFFDIPFDPAPAPTDPISIAREEFDEVCTALAEVHVPLRDDRDEAWRDFQGWRVNYDGVLLALAGLTMAPYAPWSSDRSLRYQRVVLRWRRRGRART